MTPPKASAPQADAPETRFIDGMGWVVACRDAIKYADWLKRLAAAEQPAAEPAPVAQGSDQKNIDALLALAKSNPAKLALAAIELIKEQCATIADHARRDAELRTQRDEQEQAAIRMSFKAQKWMARSTDAEAALAQQIDRADALEASLAACRAALLHLRDYSTLNCKQLSVINGALRQGRS